MAGAEETTTSCKVGRGSAEVTLAGADPSMKAPSATNTRNEPGRARRRMFAPIRSAYGAGMIDYQQIGVGKLPGHLGIEIISVEHGAVRARIVVEEHHLAPNGYMHAATIVALADTCCGYGCRESLPEGGAGFTTIELKTNFLGTALEGAIACEAALVHGGRTTQVWDATVTVEATGKTIALFRCTQMVLYPR
jgi:uncharacterized protein (TIGR00369 family)